MKFVFPPDFAWGAAASSYQIEGASREDGKGLSIWDTFCQRPGVIWGGHTGDVASDHYHHMEEDVSLMKEIGLKAYRLSISWPRVMPMGTGHVNPSGLDFYDRLIDALLHAGIEPWVTLFHWDYPYDLFLRGGWLNPESSDWFAEYTGVVTARLSDRVTKWITINEPQCFIGSGHATGRHAPGLRLDRRELLTVSHNVLLSHGKAVQTLRANALKDPWIGIAPVGVVGMPATDSPADIEAARRSMFSHHATGRTLVPINANPLWSNTWWMDPIVFGSYPEDSVEVYGSDMPSICPGDMEVISQPIDFYGVNIYNGVTVAADAEGEPQRVTAKNMPLTGFRWPVTPDSVYWGPKFLYERYGLPLALTENGLSNPDWVALDGKVHDPQRIDFLTRYLRQYARAASEGVDLRGYFVWSIMDNFEWAEGCRERFGLIHVDYETGRRTLKDSAEWYQEVIRSQGASLW